MNLALRLLCFCRCTLQTWSSCKHAVRHPQAHKACSCAHLLLYFVWKGIGRWDNGAKQPISFKSLLQAPGSGSLYASHMYYFLLCLWLSHRISLRLLELWPGYDLWELRINTTIYSLGQGKAKQNPNNTANNYLMSVIATKEILRWKLASVTVNVSMQWPLWQDVDVSLHDD